MMLIRVRRTQDMSEAYAAFLRPSFDDIFLWLALNVKEGEHRREPAFCP